MYPHIVRRLFLPIRHLVGFIVRKHIHESQADAYLLLGANIQLESEYKDHGYYPLPTIQLIRVPRPLLPRELFPSEIFNAFTSYIQGL